MDQVKIGKFIARQRKQENLTQLQLAQKLGITDRAVSKWETGKAMPDASIMLALCDILHMSVNELLRGEEIPPENSGKEMEAQLLAMVREKERNDRLLLILEWVIGILSCLVVLIPAGITSLVAIEPEWARIAVALSGILPGIIGCCLALRIEQVAGYYQCRKCGHRYVPTYRAVSLAIHLGRTRRLRCPDCGRHSWQKKVLEKT
jgi:transcriptional regulator with XRE-family HTH domain